MRSQRGAVVILLLLAFAACACLGQDVTQDKSGASASDDDKQYYDDKQYHEYNGTDEYKGYTAYDDEYESNCSLNDKGKPELRNGTTACPVKIAGVDKQAGGLEGGVDGVYDLVSCYNGKPLYRRRKTTETGREGRVLWFSDIFGDWDVSPGNDPDEGKVVLYGGEREFAALPLLVSKWQLHYPSAQRGSRASMDDGYKPIEVQITCAVPADSPV